MIRLAKLLAVAVAGVLVGGATMLVVQSRGDATSASARPPTTTSFAVTATSEPGATTTSTGRHRPEPPRTVLAWSPGGLEPGYADAVASRPEVRATTVVQGDDVLLAATDYVRTHARVAAGPGGMIVDLDAIAIDPATYPPFALRRDRAALAQLAPGQALVGTTSAELRDVAEGDRLRFTNGASVTIAGVVDDASVGAAELVVPSAGAAALGIDTDRYLLARPRGTAADAVAALQATDHGTRPLRVRTSGETPYLRSSDAVLPQSRIKATFGELAFAPRGGKDLVEDPAWVATNIVTAEVPILGAVRCHRALIDPLRHALQELADQNLAGLIQSYDGCYNPRRIREGGTISRHAWGAAIDLNFSANRTGTTSIQDPRLEEIMARFGFGSGAGWLVPDPGHFEYVGPPDP